MGGKDKHSSGGDPSLRLSGFINRLRCSALPEERGGPGGGAGALAPAGGSGASSEMLVVCILKYQK